MTECKICKMRPLEVQCVCCKGAVDNDPEWISVKDEIPDSRARVHGPDTQVSDVVLVYSEYYGVFPGYYEIYPGCYEEWSNSPNKEVFCEWYLRGVEDDLLVKDVTHWMPLPEEHKDE